MLVIITILVFIHYELGINYAKDIRNLYLGNNIFLIVELDGGNIMKIQISDTIITDEYSVMAKTEDIKKIAKKVADSPNGIVIVKGRDSKVVGIVRFREIIDLLLSKKDPAKLKFKDVIQKNIMTIKDTDNVERVIKRIRRRKPVATIVVNDKNQLVGYFSDSDMNYAGACLSIMNNILK